jgi:hypothetical protein
MLPQYPSTAEHDAMERLIATIDRECGTLPCGYVRGVLEGVREGLTDLRDEERIRPPLRLVVTG